jgi:YebC/PmpR family DNA-binding regulatory protein
MSGHSKWSTIKHKKAAKDQKRGKIFTKLIKEITVSARMGGGDVNANPRLRTAVLTARQNSMPTDNIERAIKKGTGELEGVTYEEITYEGYGPGGVAVLVRVLTDNKNRTGPEIRHIFERQDGRMGVVGSVAWMFERRGVIQVDAEKSKEDEVLELALEAGATDMRTVEKVFEITTTPDEMETVRHALEAKKMPVLEAEAAMVPQSTVRVEGKDAAAVLRLIEALEEQDDVQGVYSNYDIPDEVFDAISAA